MHPLNGLDMIPYKRELKNGKRFYRIEKDPACFATVCAEPWRFYQEPFRIAPHVYYVSGNADWANYLLDTGEGLILIDTGMNPVIPYMIAAIHRMGFDPKDIKKIFISHAHLDHDGGARAVQELSGGQIYFPPGDIEYKKEHSKKTSASRPPQFAYTPDYYYDFTTPLTMGRFTIKFVECPGHTPGVTSFFFDDTDEETGKTYHVAMHGGAGVSGKPGDENNELRKTFIADCRKMADWDIDICLPSHPNQTNTLAWLPDDRMDYTPFVDKNCWHDLMLERAAAAEAITNM